jgi:hypothetical protein
MKKDILKKFDRKKQLMVSPFALALSACGGGGGEKSELTPSLSPVRRIDPTNDDLIDMVTSGSYYRSSESTPIFYGLAHGHYGEQWENPEEVAKVLQDVMSEFPKYADIDLEYAGIFASPNAASDAGVSVIMSFDNIIFKQGGSTSNWHVFYPHADDNDYGVKQIGGDLYLNFHGPIWKANSQADFEDILTQNNVAKAMILNGMSNTLGLKGTYQKTSERPEISETEFADNSEDYTYSVSHIPNDTLSDDVGNTLGIYDILGLVYLYGPATNVNVGDSFYDLSDAAAYTVISDSAGNDTVSFSSTSRDVYIALSDFKLTHSLYTPLVDLHVGGGAINYGTPTEIEIGFIGNIENITTGSGDDWVITNASDNVIKAGAGDDLIILSEGADIIYGGSGADRFVAQFVGGDLNYIAKNTIIKDFEIGVDSLEVTDGSSELVYSRNSDGYALYTNDAGVNVVLEGVEGNILMIA